MQFTTKNLINNTFNFKEIKEALFERIINLVILKQTDYLSKTYELLGLDVFHIYSKIIFFNSIKF